MSRTFAILRVSRSTFDEILAAFKAAAYHHAIDEDDGVVRIDMHGIVLEPKNES